MLHAADPGGGTYTVEFSPDGRTLAAGGSAGVTFRDADAEAAAANVCTYAGTPLSRAEWAAYVPDRAYENICVSAVKTPLPDVGAQNPTCARFDVVEW